MIPLCCPTCRLPLCQNDNRLLCACGAAFDIVDGVPVLTHSAKYYGEISQARKRELLEQMDQGQHWRMLVWKAFGTSYSFLHHIIVDEARNDFRYILPHNPEGVVLDLGAGWGTMCTHFARDYKRVVAMDGTLDRCQFIQKRCRQDHIDNIECICANILESPLPENHFDIVLMNGVLEWIGESSEAGDPAVLQEAALKTVRRILKPDGVLYIGIENSHGFKYILGEPDDHSGLPHITYLLRPTANEKALKELKRPYRTYTYDRRGYSQLLSRAGFEQADFYYPVPDYKSVNALMTLDQNNLIGYYNKSHRVASHPNSISERVRSLETFATERGHVADHAASYSIVAGRPAMPSMTRAVADYVTENWTTMLPKKPERVDILQLSAATGKKFERGRIKLLVFADGEPSPSLVAVFARAREYDESVRKEAEIYRMPLWGDFPMRVPKVAALDSILGAPVLFRHAWPGATMHARLASVRHSGSFRPEQLEQTVGEDFRIARLCLEALHARTRNYENSSASALIDDAFGKAAAIWEPDLFPNLDALRATVSTYYENMPDCILHGDFIPSNLILNENEGRPEIGLIDWELSLVNGITILDYCRFIYYYAVLLEELQTELGNREAVLKEIFVEKKTWLSSTVGEFLAAGIPELEEEGELSVRLMQFSLLYDALLQCDHSAHPQLKLGQNFAKIYNLFETVSATAR